MTGDHIQVLIDQCSLSFDKNDRIEPKAKTVRALTLYRKHSGILELNNLLKEIQECLKEERNLKKRNKKKNKSSETDKKVIIHNPEVKNELSKRFTEIIDECFFEVKDYTPTQREYFRQAVGYIYFFLNNPTE